MKSDCWREACTFHRSILFTFTSWKPGCRWTWVHFTFYFFFNFYFYFFKTWLQVQVSLGGAQFFLPFYSFFFNFFYFKIYLGAGGPQFFYLFTFFFKLFLLQNLPRCRWAWVGLGGRLWPHRRGVNRSSWGRAGKEKGKGRIVGPKGIFVKGNHENSRTKYNYSQGKLWK